MDDGARKEMGGLVVMNPAFSREDGGKESGHVFEENQRLSGV